MDTKWLFTKHLLIGTFTQKTIPFMTLETDENFSSDLTHNKNNINVPFLNAEFLTR